MYNIPIEIINYCLEYANTGTKLVYNSTKEKLEFTFDFSHPNHNYLLRLLSMREIQIDNNNNITHIHLPWLPLVDLYPPTYNKFFVANITIHNNIQTWNSQIIYMKKTNTKENEYRYRIDSLLL